MLSVDVLQTLSFFRPFCALFCWKFCDLELQRALHHLHLLNLDAWIRLDTSNMCHCFMYLTVSSKRNIVDSLWLWSSFDIIQCMFNLIYKDWSQKILITNQFTTRKSGNKVKGNKSWFTVWAFVIKVCFISEKDFLVFFFKRLRLNESDRYADEFPYLSPCGRERNFIRCDDKPIVYTHLI